MPRAKVSSGAEYLNTALCAAHAQGTLAAAASSTPAERCGPRFATPSALYSDMLRLVLLEATLCVARPRVMVGLTRAARAHVSPRSESLTTTLCKHPIPDCR